jgi:hypothetical protein
MPQNTQYPVQRRSRRERRSLTQISSRRNAKISGTLYILLGFRCIEGPVCAVVARDTSIISLDGNVKVAGSIPALGCYAFAAAPFALFCVLDYFCQPRLPDSFAILFSCAFCLTLAPYYSCNPLSAFWRCRSLAVFCTIVPYSFAFSCHALWHSFAKLLCSLLPGSLAAPFCCRPLQYSFAAVLRSLSSLLQSFAHFCHTLCHTRLLQSLALWCHTLLQSSIFFYRTLSPHFCHTPCCSLCWRSLLQSVCTLSPHSFAVVFYFCSTLLAVYCSLVESVAILLCRNLLLQSFAILFAILLHSCDEQFC